MQFLNTTIHDMHNVSYLMSTKGRLTISYQDGHTVLTEVIHNLIYKGGLYEDSKIMAYQDSALKWEDKFLG